MLLGQCLGCTGHVYRELTIKIEVKMKKVKIVNQLNYKHSEKYEEQVSSDTETVQGDSMTVAEIFQRNQSGLITPLVPKKECDDDPDHDSIDIDEFRRSDIIDQTEMQKGVLEGEIETFNKKKGSVSEEDAHQDSDSSEKTEESEN